MNKPTITIISTSQISLPLILKLQQHHQLAGVLIPGPPTQESFTLSERLKQMGVSLCQYIDHSDAISYVKHQHSSLGIVLGCTHRISLDIAAELPFGIINLHASPLPEYRGAQPVYWQIRHGVRNTMLVAHKLDTDIDTGDIVAQLPINIAPYDTYNLVMGKVVEQAIHLVDQLVHEIQSHGTLSGTPQQTRFQHSAPRVTPDDLTIQWNKASALEICNQVRAGNPSLGGARIQFGSFHANLLQATPSSLPVYDLPPGTVLSISPKDGLIVSLKDESIKLDIIGDSEGIYDGYRYAELIELRAGAKLK